MQREVSFGQSSSQERNTDSSLISSTFMVYLTCAGLIIFLEQKEILACNSIRLTKIFFSEHNI